MRQSRSSFNCFASVISLLVCLGGCSGCGTLSYLLQAGEGQMALLNHAKPIPEVLKDEKTPPRVKRLLSEIPSIKSYGERHGLRPTPNYVEYVKLNRSAAVYVVSASEALKFKAKTWSFPVVGSFPYLGWYDLKDAKRYAEELRKEGWDADVRGAGAYSTLGWFRDPILSTMLSSGEEAMGELVDVVLHESVHATLYISGQSYFNESLASYIADRMVYEYLDEKFGKESPESKGYEAMEKESAHRLKLLRTAYSTLDKLYSSSASDQEKLEQKAEILSHLKSDLGWERDLNNATLIQFKTYYTAESDFDVLREACHGDWRRFLEALSTLKPSSFGSEQREEFGPVVRELAAKGCGG